MAKRNTRKPAARVPCGIAWCIAFAEADAGGLCRLHAERPNLHPRETRYVVELRSALPEYETLNASQMRNLYGRLGYRPGMLAPTIVAGLFEFADVECSWCDGTRACEECDGTGEHECSCGHQHDCWHCDGDGKCPECKARRREAPGLDEDDIAYLLWAQTPAYIPPEPFEVFWPESGD